MVSYTPRLNLGKQDGPEPQDVSVYNADLDTLDKSAGVLLVNDGVTPTSDLYDGCIVKEKTSGISWVAQKNGAGSFDKVWLTYPFFGFATGYSGAGLPSDTTNRNLGVDTLNSASVNCPSSLLVAGRLNVPVDGIYAVKGAVVWPLSATGNRSLSFSISNTNYNQTIDNGLAVNGTLSNYSMDTPIPKGGGIILQAWQTSGGILIPAAVKLTITLIAPTGKN